MSANMNSFFEELVEAKKAIDALPELQHKLDYTESQRRYAESRNDDFRQEIDRKNSQLLEAQATIAKLEASLDTATFQGQEVRDRLEVLLSAVRGVVKDVNETVELVSPTPKAEVIDTPPEVVASADPTFSQEGQSALDPTQSTSTIQACYGGNSMTGLSATTTSPFFPGTSAERSATSEFDVQGRKQTEVPSNTSGLADEPSVDATSSTTPTDQLASASSPSNRPKPSNSVLREGGSGGGPDWIADGYEHAPGFLQYRP